jgi:hypothetical protein
MVLTNKNDMLYSFMVGKRTISSTRTSRMDSSMDRRPAVVVRR